MQNLIQTNQIITILKGVTHPFFSTLKIASYNWNKTKKLRRATISRNRTIMDKWCDKVAIVTGASSGIGAQVFIDLAKAGINVIGIARRKWLIDNIITQNQESCKGKLYALECDVRSTQSINEAFEWIDGNFRNGIHILVNTAGIWCAGQSIELEDEQIVDTISTNYTGLVLCTRKAYKIMQKTNDIGYIVNVSSISGYLSATFEMGGTDGINVYAGAKHAVNHFSEILRFEIMHKSNNRIRISVSKPIISLKIASLTYPF